VEKLKGLGKAQKQGKGEVDKKRIKNILKTYFIFVLFFDGIL